MYFDVTPTQLSSSGEWVTVYWSGVSSPSSKDWIGVYSPPASNGYGIDTGSAPIKYQVFMHGVHSNDMRCATLSLHSTQVLHRHTRVTEVDS